MKYVKEYFDIFQQYENSESSEGPSSSQIAHSVCIESKSVVCRNMFLVVEGGNSRKINNFREIPEIVSKCR